ncbi:hypothetical protein V6N13_033983 [Hibiscus sabdariffa]|uniref:Uncharacterized protein n=1 Tax=Hibiscus sabdariffa TaxID=183260 RepID=A0ABR2F8X8_9ROSI
MVVVSLVTDARQLNAAMDRKRCFSLYRAQWKRIHAVGLRSHLYVNVACIDGKIMMVSGTLGQRLVHLVEQVEEKGVALSNDENGKFLFPVTAGQESGIVVTV